MKKIFLIAILSILSISFSQSCLTFENIDNKLITDNQITIYIRNCGQNFTYVTVMITYLNSYDKKIILSIAPNEVKPVTFQILLPLGITKTLATVYAFNNETFIQASFYIFKPEHFIKIEIPEINLIKDEKKEIFVKIVNEGNYEIENVLSLILPKNIVGYFEEEKIKILPRSEKYVKLIIYSKEAGKYNGVIVFGNFEKIFEINVKEKRELIIFPQIQNFSFLILLILFLILLALILKKIKKLDCYSLLNI